jgi:molybdopterin synthase sulfur carrier subunit
MMPVRIRFFARFRELLGKEVPAEPGEGTSIASLLRAVSANNTEGHEALFDERGEIRRFVIVMVNGTRLGPGEAERVTVSDGDDIAVFPPVAGG